MVFHLDKVLEPHLGEQSFAAGVGSEHWILALFQKKRPSSTTRHRALIGIAKARHRTKGDVVDDLVVGFTP